VAISRKAAAAIDSLGLAPGIAECDFPADYVPGRIGLSDFADRGDRDLSTNLSACFSTLARFGGGFYAIPWLFGWEDADMARVYTRKAARKKLAMSGAAKVTHRATIVPPNVPTHGMVRKNNGL
jgi:hypothetical protein